MTPDRATQMTLLAQTLKLCADALESEDWDTLHDQAEEMARLSRWLKLDDEA